MLDLVIDTNSAKFFKHSNEDSYVLMLKEGKFNIKVQYAPSCEDNATMEITICYTSKDMRDAIFIGIDTEKMLSIMFGFSL